VLPIARGAGEPARNHGGARSNVHVQETSQSWEGGAETGVHGSLVTWLRGRPHVIDDHGAPLFRVAVFDQLEQLFTEIATAGSQRNEFFAELAAALQDDPLLRVLLIVRQDFLPQLDRDAAELSPERAARFRLEGLRRNAALAAVCGPLAETSRTFAPGAAERLVDELLATRVVSSGKVIEVAGEFVNPVQLQIVCRALWQELPDDLEMIDEADLRSFGDVDLSLQMFYDDTVLRIVRQKQCSEKVLRRWFETELITPQGTRATLYRGAQRTGSLANAAVDFAESAHIVRAEWRSNARWEELAHDRWIVPILRSNAARFGKWRRLPPTGHPDG